jgi:hypothetical protein
LNGSLVGITAFQSHKRRQPQIFYQTETFQMMQWRGRTEMLSVRRASLAARFQSLRAYQKEHAMDIGQGAFAEIRWVLALWG